jgi:hypothetical protein
MKAEVREIGRRPSERDIHVASVSEDFAEICWFDALAVITVKRHKCRAPFRADVFM